MNVTAFAQRAEQMIAERDAELARLRTENEACKIALRVLQEEIERLRGK
jgi:hypothetical protein